MRPAAIYSRYSTDKQSPRSIADQEALWLERAPRDGFVVVARYSDGEASSDSLHGRPGLARLLADARAGKFSAVLVECLDRLSRSRADLPWLYERLTFLGIAIVAYDEGLIDDIRLGVRALTGPIALADVRNKVRRGMAGVVRDGRRAGGVAYGYAATPGQPGVVTIDAAQAEIVRRIFAEYVAGRTPRAIAHDLNRDGIAPPRGARWNASTINGEAKRGAGILNNELYAGRLVWNKNRMIKNPDTGRRISRANPPAEWQSVARPDLAILQPEVFAAAQARRAERGFHKRPEAHRAPRHLLSGLLRCGACGGGMSVFGADRSGRRRVRCSRAAESGTCPAPRTFYLDVIERAVLDALAAELRAPEAIAEYVRTYHAERARLAAAEAGTRARLNRRLVEIARESDRAVDGICKGIGDAVALGAKTKALAAEREAIERELAAQPPPRVIALHPAVLARYEAQLADLQRAIAAGLAAGDADMLAVRDLIESITVRAAKPPHSVEIEITGRLGALIGEKAFPDGVIARVRNGGSGGRI